VTREEIRLDHIILIDRPGSFDTVSKRLASARVQTEEPLPPLILSRADVDKVELIRFDAGKTLRKAAFWTYGSTLLVLLLNERS